jgi:prepilin-type processing-associated H-X9-DG protein
MMLILPYIEQTNVYNQINISVAAFDTQNVPPNQGGGGMYGGNGSAYSVTINAFLCPSSPQPGSINYWNAQWTNSGNGSGAANQSPPTQIWGLTDYFAVPGFHCDLIAALGLDPNATSDNSPLCNNEPGLISSPGGYEKGNTIASATDGTSNTVMLGESCGRPIGYNHSRQIYSVGIQSGSAGSCASATQKVDGVLCPAQGGGGAWGDPYTYAHLAGSSPSGQRGASYGTCLVNCTSDNELFSFHPGGVNLCFGDGSIHFIKETINPKVLVYLVCRADGNIVSSDQY